MILPTDVYSPDQVSSLIMELRGFVDAANDASRHSDGTERKPDASDLLQSLFNATGDMSAEQLLKELEALLKNAPTVHVITAALPGHDLKRQLTFWFRREIHEHTMITFTERRDIGGGIIIRAGAHIYDFSFKRKLVDNKHRITEIAFGAPAAVQPQETASV